MHKKKCCIGSTEGSIRGARDLVSSEQEVRAIFSGTNLEEIASLFFEHTAEIVAPTELYFEEGTKKMFFLRVENFSSAELPLEITVEKNSEIFFVFLLQDAQESTLNMSISTNVAEKSHVHFSGIHLGSGASDITLTTKLNGENATAHTVFTEIGNKKSTANVTITNQSHASHTSGDIKTRCILRDNAKSSITGIPDVQLHAEHCTSHLDQKTILLSPAARSISVPQLNIANNKVEASHKSSFVHLSAEDEFYLQSRGVSKQSIANLLLDGMLAETLNNIPEEAIQKCIGEAAHSFLQGSV